MSWLSPFRRIRTPKTRRAPQARPRSRPQLEALEERTLLNNRFVVPVGAPVDNTTNFATLQQALTTAGLANGDTIQIEPGSAPGNVVNANFTTAFTAPVTSLTIQGDPAVGVSAIPQFTISDATTIAAGNTLNLKNANVGLVTAGSLTFNGNAAITGSILVNVSSTANNDFTFGGSTDILTGSTVVNNVAPGFVVFDVNTPAAGSSNVISGNTFVSNSGTGVNGTNIQLAYNGGVAAAVTDKVSGNTFIASPGTQVNIALFVQESVTGLTIQNNTFSGAVNFAIDQISSTPQNLQILGNTVNISGAAPIGILINGGGAATTTSAVISANVLNAGPNGTGLSITVGAGTLNTSVQGNDFHGNKVGVNIIAGANTITGIDLGGGNQGSLGDNNFRSFTATATAGAIVTNATTGTIQAQNNIFAVANPQTVIFATAGATVNATALSANAAYVAVIYNDFLKRPGNTTNAADAGGFVNLLNGGSNSLAVASSLIRSPESLGVIVNGLYLKIFNRTAEAGGTQFFVGLLQKNFTIEQVITVMVTSTEFANQAGSDGGFVQLLYLKLLGRTANQGEVSFWVSLIGTPGVGRAGVAKAILGSAEFRGDVIQAVYGFTSGTPGNLPPTSSVVSILPNMLHRTAAPGAGELAFWQNLPLDIGNEVVIIASSPEFFNNG